MNRCIINIKALAESNGQNEVLHLDDSFFESFDSSEIAGGNIEVSIKSSKLAEANVYSVTLNIKGTVKIPCTRCLDMMDFEVDLADGVEVAADSDNCVETIKSKPTQKIGAVAYYSAVTFDTNGNPYVTFATVYENGNCIVKKANNVEVARGTNPGGTVTEMGGVPVRIVDNNTVYYYYRADGSAIGAVPMSEITIKGYPSGILSVKETVNADGSVTLSNEYGSATFGAY